MRNTTHTTQLSQGTGLINETLSLLSIYQKGMSIKELTDYVRDHDTLSCQTDRRLKHITHDVFYMRFMKNDPSVPIWLNRIRNNGLPLKQFSQILMIYCAREHAVLFDAIVHVLNRLKSEKRPIIEITDLTDFVLDIIKNGQAKWSEIMQRKNAGYIRSTLVDFDFIDRRGAILPYELYDMTILYLLYEQHFAGLSDMAIWDLEEWKLFNLDRRQVLDRVMGLSLKGAYMAQTSGDLLTISWNYQSMEEFIDATV